MKLGIAETAMVYLKDILLHFLTEESFSPSVELWSVINSALWGYLKVLVTIYETYFCPVIRNIPSGFSTKASYLDKKGQTQFTYILPQAQPWK